MKCALEAKWHSDLAGKFSGAGRPILIQPLIGIIEFEFPSAVEVDPVGALELRLRIFGAGNFLSRQRQRGQREHYLKSHG